MSRAQHLLHSQERLAGQAACNFLREMAYSIFEGAFVATIPLRDYLSGIEELIESEQFEDALTHCRHILGTFPKHVDTYRMMGKAYLEAHRYTEAGDIFQRVLSTCPDDFVAHIGMSIIREEAGDQDGAIWNMERAFEAQPSNRAVQDELRRLYGKREGYAPPKVRLTRGALARMYAHGDLFNQAISELRGALAEDAQRPDLQVLLAEMFLKTGRQTEAMDVCAQLIEKYPYCLYANQVMAEILTGNQREIQAGPYIERVRELDPYAVQVQAAGSSGPVPADSVMVEQLTLDGSTADQASPRAWTGALQATDTEAFGKEDLPDWLSFEEDKEEPSAVQEQPKKEAEAETGPSLLGSLESLEPSPQGEEPEPEAPPAVPAFTKTPTAALMDDQIPDWLRELGPATGTLSSEMIEEETGTTDKLEGIPPQEKITGDLPADAIPSEEPKILPAEHAVEPQAEEEDDSLGWLERLAADQGAAEEELLTTPEERESASPDWAPSQEEDAAKSDTLTWLDEMEADAEKGREIIPASPPEPIMHKENPDHGDEMERTTPAWLKELSAEAEEIGKKTGHLDPYELEEGGDWLNELRPQSGPATEDTPEEPVAEAEGDKPPSGDLSRLDWMDDLGEPEQPKEGLRQNAWVPETELGAKQEVAAPAPEPVAPAALLRPKPTARQAGAAQAADLLEQARQALNFGKVDDAADHYGKLLRRRLLLNEVIADLEAAVHRNPADSTLWQTLGDGYMRNGQLREALDCYNKAETLL